jgi:hypothetical protein
LDEQQLQTKRISFSHYLSMKKPPKDPDRPLMATHVAQAVGATKRQVQLWSDAGVLRAVPGTDRAGRGRQRIYLKSELPLAALASFLSAYQIPIGRLQVIVSDLRHMIGGALPHVQDILSGKRHAYMIVEPAVSLGPGGMAKFYDFLLPDDVRGPRHSFVAWCNADELDETLSNMSGAIVVNLTKVISPFIEKAK